MKLLKHARTGRIYVYHETLAKMPEMIPYEEPKKKKPGPRPRKVKNEQD